eukprot:TRINITY_DN10304_c0_g1_i1.p1 TRINITY_DN10304_c0_g1~~TRINITY_DN10304_c0_g1_i1.p1  ORF type:complete len:187 (+),score=64.31 TRINITY_DN10304_c0_g1_i1:80-562(+)
MAAAAGADTDSFHALFNESAGKQNRRTVPMSGGSAEKHRANRQELSGASAARKPHGGTGDIDLAFLDDPTAISRDRAAASCAAATLAGERVITDNVEAVERQMLADAPQGDYQLDSPFDQAYKDMMRDKKSIVAHDCDAETKRHQGKEADDDDEFDVFDK